MKLNELQPVIFLMLFLLPAQRVFWVFLTSIEQFLDLHKIYRILFGTLSIVQCYFLCFLFVHCGIIRMKKDIQYTKIIKLKVVF